MNHKLAPLSLGPDVVTRLLPHRRPFLMVDSIEGYSRAPRPTLSAARMVSANEPVFAAFEKTDAGKDVDIIGNGFLKLRDPWDAAQLDFIVRFSFSDAYKAKDDKTVALFGDPNDPTMPALLDFDKRMKKGKREDG